MTKTVKIAIVLGIVVFAGGVFAIPEQSHAGFVTLTSPNGGEVVQPGQLLRIQWTNTDSSSVNLYYQRNNGIQTLIAANTTGTFYDWFVPSNLGGSDYRIVVTSNSTNNSDTSNGFFTIGSGTSTNPAVTVTTPNGGESYHQGQIIPIRWNRNWHPQTSSNFSGRIRIQYRGTNGLHQTIAENVLDGTTYNWTPPSHLSGSYKITVQALGSGGSISSPLSDESDNWFTINGSATNTAVTVINPNGGQTYQAGQTIPITWTRNWYPTNSNNRVNIYYQRGSGSRISIATNVTDGTTYHWTIPPNITLASNYRIVVESQGAGSNLSDVSNSFFTINSSHTGVAPHITSLSPFQPTAGQQLRINANNLASFNNNLYINGNWIGNFSNQGGYISVFLPSWVGVGQHNLYIITDNRKSNTVYFTVPSQHQTNLYQLHQIFNGDLIRAQGDIGVYIVKRNLHGSFKRRIFGPQVFNAYGHLNFDRVKVVSHDTLNYFQNSDLIRLAGTQAVYSIDSIIADIGATRHWIANETAFYNRGYNFGGVYEVNNLEFNLYTPGTTLY